MADAAPFDLQVRSTAEATVVVIEGELDILSAQEAGDALTRAQEGGGTVVLDLRELQFMDSSGLRLVLQAHRRAHAGGGRLLVAPGEDAVRRVLDLSGVGDLLDLVDAPPEAA